MPTLSNDRHFVVGETIYVRVKVSEPGTKRPTDPDEVVLATLLREGDDEPTVVPDAFGRLAEGDYTLGIPSASLATGTYSLTVRVQGPNTETPVRVVLKQDRFILRAV